VATGDSLPIVASRGLNRCKNVDPLLRHAFFSVKTRKYRPVELLTGRKKNCQFHEFKGSVRVQHGEPARSVGPGRIVSRGKDGLEVKIVFAGKPQAPFGLGQPEPAHAAARYQIAVLENTVGRS
jgi:hypothetical protein